MVGLCVTESNGVNQKKNEKSKTRRDASTAIDNGKTGADPGLVKRSVKTSGIEDNDNGEAAKN